MVKKVVQRGRSERRGESYFAPYGELLRFTTRRIRSVTVVNAAAMVRRQCLARRKLAGFFNILLRLAALAFTPFARSAVAQETAVPVPAA